MTLLRIFTAHAVRACAATLIALVLSGCATGGGGILGPAKFEVVADPGAASQVLLSRNNRVSVKSVAGGFHGDALGVYLDPAISTPPKDQAARLALRITNHQPFDSPSDGAFSLGTLQEVSFLIDSSRMLVLPIARPDSMAEDVFYASIGKSITVAEGGVAALTREQFQQIAEAEQLEIKIVGTRRSVTYKSEEISSTFMPNLRLFYQQYVAS